MGGLAYTHKWRRGKCVTLGQYELKVDGYDSTAPRRVALKEHKEIFPIIRALRHIFGLPFFWREKWPNVKILDIGHLLLD